MSKRSRYDEMTNSPWALLLAVPAMLIGCFAVIVVGAIGVIAWAASTMAAWMPTRSKNV